MDEIEKVIVQEHDILQFVISKDYYLIVRFWSIDDMGVFWDWLDCLEFVVKLSMFSQFAALFSPAENKYNIQYLYLLMEFLIVILDTIGKISPILFCIFLAYQ